MALIASGKQKVPHPIFHSYTAKPGNPVSEFFSFLRYAHYAIKSSSKLRE
jgi:hypothetical protein